MAMGTILSQMNPTTLTNTHHVGLRFDSRGDRNDPNRIEVHND